jgi:uncharacterized membrane protein
MNSKTTAASVGALAAGGKLLQKALGQSAKALGADPERPNRATQTLTVAAGPDELYRFFRDPGNLQRALRNVAEIRPQGDGSARWKIAGQDGTDLEWDTRLVEERPDELLRWSSGPGAQLPAKLEVRLWPAPTGGGTAITMRLELEPTGGAGAAPGAATALGAAAGAFVIKALYRTKALLETGEVPTLERNPSARPGEGDRI